MEVGIKQAKNDLSKLVSEARSGTRVYLMNRGKRVAEIVPTDQTDTIPNRGLGMFKDKFKGPSYWDSPKNRARFTKEFMNSLRDVSK